MIEFKQYDNEEQYIIENYRTKRQLIINGGIYLFFKVGLYIQSNNKYYMLGKIEQNEDGSIEDYKFLCFNGRFQYLWIDKNRYSNHKRGFWNRDLQFLQGVESDHPTFDVPPILPFNINGMISIAEKLSEDFPFARIDLYNIQGEIIFGEITFYPWSGYVKYVPDSFDFELGNCFAEY